MAVSFSTLEVSVMLFVAGLIATAIGVGWGVNYRRVNKALAIGDKNRSYIKEIFVTFGGSDALADDIGEIGQLNKQLEAIHDEQVEIRETVEDLVWVLHDLESVEEFDRTDILRRGSNDR